MRQINRHYFTPKLYALESLFQYSKDRTAFLETYDSGLSKLEVFKNIHELEPASDEESTSLETVSVANDDSLSFIEMEEEIKLYCNSPSKNQNSESDTDDSLNTSVSSTEDSAGTGAKREFNDYD